MASEISNKAEIDPKSRIGNNCKIYPFAYIEGDVVIGDNCVIYPFVSVMNGTRMGNNNTIYQNTVLGAVPQDFDYTGADTELIIGNHNTIRENVVINRATNSEGKTVLGNENFLLEGAHVSHDTIIGDKCVLGYGTKIAGDCYIGNDVVFSANVIMSAKARVGDASFIKPGATFRQDVPPYVVAGGEPMEYCGLNSVILNALNVTEKNQKHIANAYRLLFHGQTSVIDAIQQIKEQVPMSDEIEAIISFMTSTTNGLITKL